MLTLSNILKLLVAGFALSGALSLNAEDRIWLEAKINGKPVRLCFDSGSNVSCLTRDAAQRLGLKFNETMTNGVGNGESAAETEEFGLNLEGRKLRTRFPILEFPPYANPDFDGIIGWFTLWDNVMEIDAVAKEVSFLEKVPKRTAQWTRFPIVADHGTLDLQITHDKRTNGVICIDSGNGGGLWLPSRDWELWKKAHPNALITLGTAFSPVDGFYVYEEAWADEIPVGTIVLKGVPVARSGPGTEKRIGACYEGTLGLAALKRLEVTVDGKRGLAYLHPKSTRPPAYDHNRLGAVFVPTDTRTNQAVARVIEGGPAYDAGVRSGDVLLRVDDIAVRSWSDTWLSRFYLPAGTRLKLSLQRDERAFETTAILREIVKSGATSKGASPNPK